MFTLDEIWTKTLSLLRIVTFTPSSYHAFYCYGVFNIIGKLTSRSCYIPAYYCEEALILASTLYQDQSK